MLQFLDLVCNHRQFVRTSDGEQRSVASIGFQFDLGWQDRLQCVEQAGLVNAVHIDLEYFDRAIRGVGATCHQLHDFRDTLLLIGGCDHDQLACGRVGSNLKQRKEGF